jgi:hypothetical protein
MASTPGGLDGALATGAAAGAIGVVGEVDAGRPRLARLLGGAAKTGSSATKAKSSWLLVKGLP